MNTTFQNLPENLQRNILKKLERRNFRKVPHIKVKRDMALEKMQRFVRKSGIAMGHSGFEVTNDDLMMLKNIVIESQKYKIGDLVRRRFPSRGNSMWFDSGHEYYIVSFDLNTAKKVVLPLYNINWTHIPKPVRDIIKNIDYSKVEREFFNVQKKNIMELTHYNVNGIL